MNTPYCYEMYKGMHITPLTGEKVMIAPCCQNPGKPVSTDEVSINHSVLQELRDYTEKNYELPPSCSQCIKLEEQGMDSRRLKNLFRATSEPNQVELEFLSYVTYRNCNLACVMCSPFYSTTWMQELDKYHNNTTRPQFITTKNIHRQFKLDYRKLKWIHFSGGEPFLNNDMYDILGTEFDFEPRIFISTNGTQPINKKLEERFKRLGPVTIYLSTDGFKDVFEYTRWPAKWSNHVDFIDQVANLDAENIHIELTANLGLHNIHSYPDLARFASDSQIPLRITRTDRTLALDHLPASTIYSEYFGEWKNSRLDKIISFAGKNIDWKWVGYLDQLDRMRGTDWRETLHVLWENVEQYSGAHYSEHKLHMPQDYPDDFVNNLIPIKNLDTQRAARK